MKLDAPVPFEQRYDLCNQLWLDGPHSGWLALDRISGREVIVNRPYRPDDQWFLQVGLLRARLRHANLIPVYDLGSTEDGTPFFTEPHFGYTDIQRSLHDREDPSTDVTLVRLISYLLDACKAVAFIHGSGFLHLDLRPGNVLVTPQFQEVFVVNGHPALPPVSFESWGAIGELKGAVVGVPAYLAPERVEPERLGVPDTLTDVYGLGGILFEILYDHPPNGGRPASAFEVLTALRTRKGPPRRGTFGTHAARCRDLALELEPTCLQALESDRTARQSSVAAFAKEVEQCFWGWDG